MRRELELVNAELEFAEAAVTRMKATRSRLLSSMHGHEMALRPILSIPDDVLRVIFEWAVHLCQDRDLYDLHAMNRASPWTISRTCSSWRTLAISHHTLWCTFVAPKSINFLNLSLQRAANTECGYSVHFPLSERDIGKFRTILAPLLKPTSGRWRSLTAYAIACDSLYDTFGGWSFERLAQLALSFVRCAHDAQSIAVTSFRNTPSLRRVSTRYLSNNYQLDIPWGQLVFYESRNSDLGILSQLSAVETILINSHYEIDWSDTFDLLKTKAPIRFPFLRTLSLRVEDNNDDIMPNLSEILEVPSLKRLLLTFDDMTILPEVALREPPKVHFLERLTHLSVTVTVTGPDYLLDLLRCARRVTVLYLGAVAFSVPVLRALQDTRVLPCLECLQSDCWSFYTDYILTVIEQRHCRFQIINKLASTKQSQDEMQEDLLDKWRSLCEQGIITIDTVNREFQLEHIMI